MKNSEGKSRLDQLLALQGEEFVRAAYRAILGRDADDDGLRHYLKRLSLGEAPTSVLEALAASTEGRAHLGQALVTDADQALALLQGTSDRDFVEGLYKRLLGRGADPGGLANYLHVLAGNQGDRRAIATGMFASEEGKAWRDRTAAFRDEMNELVAFEHGARQVTGWWRRSQRTERRIGQLEVKLQQSLNKLTRRVDAVLHPPKPAGLPGMEVDEDGDELVEPAEAYRRVVEKPVPLSPEAQRLHRRLHIASRAARAGGR